MIGHPVAGQKEGCPEGNEGSDPAVAPIQRATSWKSGHDRSRHISVRWVGAMVDAQTNWWSAATGVGDHYQTEFGPAHLHTNGVSSGA